MTFCRTPRHVLLILLLSLTGIPATAAAEEPRAGPPVPLGAAGVGSPLDLAQCLQLGLQRHPRVAAQRAGLAAAEDGIRALEALSAPPLLVPDLPVRRKQAALGKAAAVAALDEAERETAYAVTRCYFSVVYAREQERVARGVVDRLTTLRDAAKRQLDSGARDVTITDVSRVSVYLRLAETRRIEAAQGVKRALAALREAIAQGPVAPLDIPEARLPVPDVRPSRHEVIAAALARRGSLVQAVVFAEVASLEVAAQALSHHRRLETFATGSDIHSAQVPQVVRGAEYRPGGIPPEMPSVLVGPRSERVKHAESLQCRAAAALEGTRNLIALEAEEAFLQWEQASLQTTEALAAAEEADRMAEDLTKDFTAGAKIRVEDVVNVRVLASQARSQANEFRYRQLLSLADLERITAGGFHLRLNEAKAPRPGPEPSSPNGSR